MKIFNSTLSNNLKSKHPQSVSHHFSSLIILSFILFICFSITLFLPGFFFPVSSSNLKQKNVLSPIIIIDAGHGGADPGKVGTKGTLEKDINLNIALYLKEILESQEMTVILTREKDMDLATESSNFKSSDMKNRVSFIHENNGDMAISIHQNSYTDPRIYGAQCFYHTSSEDGKTLASYLQQQIIASTNQTKIREIKGNEDYYLLKHSEIPTVIVECGFLSNPQEEQLLLQANYQRKMAWAIHLGILNYLNRSQ